MKNWYRKFFRTGHHVIACLYKDNDPPPALGKARFGLCADRQESVDLCVAVWRPEGHRGLTVTAIHVTCNGNSVVATPPMAARCGGDAGAPCEGRRKRRGPCEGLGSHARGRICVRNSQQALSVCAEPLGVGRGRRPPGGSPESVGASGRRGCCAAQPRFSRRPRGFSTRRSRP